MNNYIYVKEKIEALDKEYFGFNAPFVGKDFFINTKVRYDSSAIIGILGTELNIFPPTLIPKIEYARYIDISESKDYILISLLFENNEIDNQKYWTSLWLAVKIRVYKDGTIKLFTADYINHIVDKPLTSFDLFRFHDASYRHNEWERLQAGLCRVLKLKSGV